MALSRRYHPLDGITYPRPGYAVDFDYDASRDALRLRVRGEFPCPDDEFADPKLFVIERHIADVVEVPKGQAVQLVRDTLYRLEHEIVDQWLVIDGRPYRAAIAGRDKAISRKFDV